MAQGVVDVNVLNGQNENTVFLITNCSGGLPNDLHLIPDGMEVTLKRGNAEKKAIVLHETGAECAFNYMEIHPDTAKTFGLRDGNRVVLNYDSGSKELRIQRLTKSLASGLVLPDQRKYRDGSIVIGYSLLSLLGIPNLQGTSVTLQKNSVSKKLKVIIPTNELDADLRLTPANLRKFGLVPGKPSMLEYDQTTKTLRILTDAAVTSKLNKLSRLRRPVQQLKRAASGWVSRPSDSSARAAASGTIRSALVKSREMKAAKKSRIAKTKPSFALIANNHRMGKLTGLSSRKKRTLGRT